MHATESLAVEPSLVAWGRRRLRVVERSSRPIAVWRHLARGVDDALFASTAIALGATVLVVLAGG